jgi:hypothetical protein
VSFLLHSADEKSSSTGGGGGGSGSGLGPVEAIFTGDSVLGTGTSVCPHWLFAAARLLLRGCSPDVSRGYMNGLRFNRPPQV